MQLNLVPSGWYWPLGQSTQTDALLAPLHCCPGLPQPSTGLWKYLPAPQEMHELLSVWNEYFPHVHAMQLEAPEDGWYCPEAQESHSEYDDEPEPWNLPAAQSIQLE